MAYLLREIPFDGLLKAAAGASLPLVLAGMLGLMIVVMIFLFAFDPRCRAGSASCHDRR